MSKNNSRGPLSPAASVVATRVRYGETDRMGVVYHANYFAYFEMGRTEHLRQAGVAYADLEKQGLSMVVVEVGAEYKSPASYDDELVITTTVTAMTHARIRFDYSIRKGHDPAPVATGHTVLACLDPAGKVMRIPEHVSKALTHGKPGPSASSKMEHAAVPSVIRRP